MKEPGFVVYPHSVDREIDIAMRPGIIDEAHALANQYQQSLDAFEGSSEAREQFAIQIVSELDANCGHMNAPISLSGTMYVKRIDLEQVGHSEQPVKQGDVILNEPRLATSLGYTAIFEDVSKTGPMYIKHVALAEPKPSIAIPSFGQVLTSEMFYVPIDNTAHIEIADEEFPPHEEMLRYFVPEIFNKVDHALQESDTLTQRLRKLSKIDFNSSEIISDKAGGDILNELALYINTFITPEINTLYKASGVTRVLVPTEERMIQANVAGFRTIGVVNGVRFIGTANELMLGMEVPFKGQGLQEIFLPLTGRIQLTLLDEITFE